MPTQRQPLVSLENEPKKTGRFRTAGFMLLAAHGLFFLGADLPFLLDLSDLFRLGQFLVVFDSAAVAFFGIKLIAGSRAK